MPAVLLVALATAAAPPSPPPVEGAFKLSGSDTSGYMAALGPAEQFVAVRCTPGDKRMTVFAQFRETIGFAIAYPNGGGFSVRYAFDGGKPRATRWSAAGSMATAMGPASGPHDFVAHLKGTRSLVMSTKRKGGTQSIAFAYPDPGEVVDELARRCGIALD